MRIRVNTRKCDFPLATYLSEDLSGYPPCYLPGLTLMALRSEPLPGLNGDGVARRCLHPAWPFRRSTSAGLSDYSSLAVPLATSAALVAHVYMPGVPNGYLDLSHIVPAAN